MNRPRIVSLLPSATEIACALGATADLVGISHECDFPAELQGIPVLTSSRVGNGASSGAIDAAVRALVHDALSIYAVDQLRLAELSPDLILTQDLCRVCAVSLSAQDSPETKPEIVPVAGGVKLTVFVPDVAHTARTVRLGLVVTCDAFAP